MSTSAIKPTNNNSGIVPPYQGGTPVRPNPNPGPVPPDLQHPPYIGIPENPHA